MRENRRTKRYGFFGGSFDPLHKGHVALASAALKELNLDRVYFVPTARNPLKEEEETSPPAFRLRLVRAVVKSHKKFYVSLWEIKKKGPSYTERTLRAFRSLYPKVEWHLILGGDAFNQFSKWRHWQKILEKHYVVVGKRKGVATKRNLQKWGHRLIFLKTVVPRVSSSEIRKKIREGKSVRKWLPSEVRGFIKKYG